MKKHSYSRRQVHKAFISLKRRTKSFVRVVAKSNFSKKTRKYLKMDKKKLTRLMLSTFRHEVSVRPRIKLVCIVIGLLLILLGASIKASLTLQEKEEEIKVNGRAVLVADKSEAEILFLSDPEVSAVITPKRTPFEFKFPVDGVISQKFSSFHRAYDIATKLGSEIKPLGKGRVEFAGSVSDGKGNIVVINHGDSLKSLYAHMGKIQVGVGDEVDSDTVIGLVGLTGRTTGPHVHLEIYDTDILIDPSDILPDRDSNFPVL